MRGQCCSCRRAASLRKRIPFYFTHLTIGTVSRGVKPQELNTTFSLIEDSTPEFAAVVLDLLRLLQHDDRVDRIAPFLRQSEQEAAIQGLISSVAFIRRDAHPLLRDVWKCKIFVFPIQHMEKDIAAFCVETPQLRA